MAERIPVTAQDAGFQVIGDNEKYVLDFASIWLTAQVLRPSTTGWGGVDKKQR
jgi:hypothetical protein